jgi:tetratricopeptide (TPR) repeat protein
VFRKLEKLLKRTGHKYLVLDLAELTIKAASHQPRSVEDARAQAHALICGSSWAYQRIGDLDTARTLARQSLTLGDDLSWDRNTAFCLKCEGRIMRLQAERTPSQRSSLLTASAESINTAIQKFISMSEIGPTHPEVGDCFSLLARTYLVAREYDKAQAALRKAYELIPPNGSKDHLDLLILTGDLYAATGDKEAAERTYGEALDLPEAQDVQVSEIFARGHYQRGWIRERLQRPSQATKDYECAAKLWLHLEEFEQSAKARWHHIYLQASTEKAILDEIAQEESFLVRVTAYGLYLQRYPAPAAVARRKQPTKQQLAQLLKDSREQTAVQYPHR